jgi:hypothetical protein
MMEAITRDESTMKMDVVALTETKKEQEVKHWEIIYTYLAE